jgi:4-amino-4-deoxy-L-arabinose transferase-like glycosyltransferase
VRESLQNAGRALTRWFARRWPLLAVVAFALLLHLPLLFGPVGGYHAYNEGFYANRARIQVTQPILATILKPADLNNMPLFSWLLTIFVWIFGSAEWAIRLLPLGAALASVFLVGLLGEELVSADAAVPAALLLALMPVQLIVGTNVQPDMLMVAFALAGVVLYVRSYRAAAAGASELGPRVASGVMFALGMLAKLNAVLYLASVGIWETARRGSLKWLTRRSAMIWVGTCAALPLLWVLAQTLAGGGGILQSQGRLAGIGEAPNLAFFRFLIGELPSQLGWLTTIAVIAGAVRLRSGRRAPLWLAGWMAIVATLFFFFYHFHTYYLLPLAPAAAVLGAAGLDQILPRPRRRAVLAGLVILTLPLTLSFYNLKLPHSTVRTASAWMRGRAPGGGFTVVVPRPVMDNNGETFRYYLPGDLFATAWPAAPAKPRFLVYLDMPDASIPPGVRTYERQTYIGPILFGQAMWVEFASIHEFTITGIRTAPSDPFQLFGVARGHERDFGVVDLARLSPGQIAQVRAAWEAGDGAP